MHLLHLVQRSAHADQVRQQVAYQVRPRYSRLVECALLPKVGDMAPDVLQELLVLLRLLHGHDKVSFGVLAREPLSHLVGLILEELHVDVVLVRGILYSLEQCFHQGHLVLDLGFLLQLLVFCIFQFLRLVGDVLELRVQCFACRFVGLHQSADVRQLFLELPPLLIILREDLDRAIILLIAQQCPLLLYRVQLLPHVCLLLLHALQVPLQTFEGMLRLRVLCLQCSDRLPHALELSARIGAATVFRVIRVSVLLSFGGDGHLLAHARNGLLQLPHGLNLVPYGGLNLVLLHGHLPLRLLVRLRVLFRNNLDNLACKRRDALLGVFGVLLPRLHRFG
mmetsp:Transcript_118585/g.342901  ORF Transcript_118585/g.342901 Transcript_118585/m.342901 type:complete len:337 (-) Transcript_118585:891-1901(-)